MTEKEKMLAGELYDASDPELHAERGKARRLLRKLHTADCGDIAAYRAIVSELLPNCAVDVWVEPPFACDYGYNISCGEKVFFNFDCVVLDVAPVRIGSRCLFAPKVQLLTATHPTDYRLRRSKLEYGRPITIGDDCWFGGGAIVCPGVTIGDRVVVGAGAVVIRDLPSDCVAAGNPARIIRRTE